VSVGSFQALPLQTKVGQWKNRIPSLVSNDTLTNEVMGTIGKLIKKTEHAQMLLHQMDQLRKD
jgi:hypothetical protein